ncbi:MAG: FKBP-type peptidyl-prolyl cis-trans isomerase [Bacteroidia bacterium]|nr:FKBP-type peptidyl-prolyl cis-trans isomerase [Bacteroidia bacterium]
MKKYGYLFLLVPALLFVSCKKKQDRIDADLIQDYISENSLDAVAGEEGLYYVVDSLGTGANPSLSSEITVDYEGFLLNGTKFDSSIDNGQPLTFPLSGLIRGWQLGMPHYKAGGGGILILPSSLGYGSNHVGTIPANSVLVFNIHLIAVN